MNFNQTGCFNVSQDESQFGYLGWSDYASMGVCAIGIVTVCINIRVFLSAKLSDQTYKFLLVEACVDLLYLSLLSCSPLIYSPYFDNELAPKLYSLIIDDYLTSCMAFNNILIELFLSIQRLSIVLNRSFLRNAPFWRIVFVIFGVSLVFYAPVISLKVIDRTDEQNATTATSFGYELKMSTFGDSSFGRLVLPILSTVRVILVSVCLSSVNVFCLFKFRAYMRRKSRMLQFKSNYSSSHVLNKSKFEFLSLE